MLIHLAGLIFHETELATSSGSSIVALKDSKVSGEDQIIVHPIELLDRNFSNTVLYFNATIVVLVCYTLSVL